MSISKARLGQDDNISFDCPKCSRHIRVPLSRIGRNYHCRVKCTCDFIFTAEIEFRGRSRKQVDLAGSYVVIGHQYIEAKPGNNCRIIDISRTGIGFLITDAGPLKPGDIVRLRFKLDDTARTEVSQDCEVVHFKNNFVGGQMLSENTSLEFYLLD